MYYICTTYKKVRLKLRFFPFSEHRLADYYVYAYSPDDATWDNFDAGKGILCYHHNGVSPPVIHIACTREVQGQYVKIFMEHNPRINANTLTLCEVEVYISRDLHRQTSSRLYAYHDQTNKI